jgi:predicted RNase H-like HicB family nuclease
MTQQQKFLIDLLSGQRDHSKADGDSYANALANAQIIIDEWIETALLHQRAIPQPKGRLLFA